MGSALASRSRDRHDLAGDTARGILTDLIQRRGRVHVLPETTAGKVEWNGVVTHATDEHLWLELATSNAHEGAVRTSTPLCIVFESGRTCYLFNTTCASVDFGTTSTMVRIPRPVKVTKVERRRSPRRGLREPLRVRIRSDRASGALDERASLLNLSADGMACRITNDASAVAINDVVRVSFDLNRPDARFDLQARVMNVTRGASAHQVILGLEFVADDMVQADRDRLVVALAATGPH